MPPTAGPAILDRRDMSIALRDSPPADSVALDPHKWLFVPVEAGLVFGARRGGDALGVQPGPALPAHGTAARRASVDRPGSASSAFQQTRGFRALKVWMAMKEFGLAGYKAAIEANIALAAYLADCVRAAPDLELTAPPGLSVVCFRVAGRSHEDEGAIAASSIATVLDRLQLGGEAFLSGTELRGRFTLRACIVNYRSTRQDIDRRCSTLSARLARSEPLIEVAQPLSCPAVVGRALLRHEAAGMVNMAVSPASASRSGQASRIARRI